MIEVLANTTLVIILQDIHNCMKAILFMSWAYTKLHANYISEIILQSTLTQRVCIRGKKYQVNISYIAFLIYSDNIYYGVSLGSSMVKNLMPRQEMKETHFRSLNWEGHLQKRWQPAPVFLPWKSQGQRNRAGYISGGYKESDTTEHAHTITCITQNN